MSVTIMPPVKEWRKQEPGFLIQFEAYDENGEKCTGERFRIRYGVSYDGTPPVANHSVNSDTNGGIAVTTSRECVITMYAYYAVDIHDASKGMKEQEIVKDYTLTFEPFIKEIKAEYIGGSVDITDDYDMEKLKITALYSDNTMREISYYWCNVSGHIITAIGRNVFYLSYYDAFLNTTWETSFNVTGVEKLLSMEAFYVGEELNIGDRIHEQYVKVYGEFMIKPGIKERREIPSGEWSFLSIPVVPDLNVGNIKIQIGYKDQTVWIDVPCIPDTNVTRLNIWYEGLPIEPVSPFLADNVRAFIIEPDGKRYRIPNDRITFDSQIVEKEGWNWFTAEYKDGVKAIHQQFPVLGVIPKKYIDLPFKVLYIKDNEEINMTGEFWNTMDTGGVLNITWKKFLDEVNRQASEENNPCYGKFLVTVPKLSGMSRQYDTLWEVTCINENSIKALLRKSYNEEVNDNGKEKI